MLPNGLSPIHAINGSQVEQPAESAAARLEKILSQGLVSAVAQSAAAPPPPLSIPPPPIAPGLPPPGPPPPPPLGLVAGLPSQVTLPSTMPLSLPPPAPPVTVPQALADMGQQLFGTPPPPVAMTELTQQSLGISPNLQLMAQIGMTSPAAFASPSSMTAVMLSSALTSPAGVMGTSSMAPIAAHSVSLPSANELENIAIAQTLGQQIDMSAESTAQASAYDTAAASGGSSASDALTRPGEADLQAEGQRIEALHPETTEAVQAEIASKATASANESKANKQSRRTVDHSDGKGKDEPTIKNHQPSGKLKKRKATRRIEEIWGLGQDDLKDVALPPPPPTDPEAKEERKRRRNKNRIEELWAQTETPKQNKELTSHSTKAKDTQLEVSPQLDTEQSQTAIALLASAESQPVNEALEKAKAAMAAIESQAEQTLQLQQERAPQPVGDMANQQQLAAWMSSAGTMSDEQQMAVHSAVAASQQAQFMQQFQFYHQYRQHENQRTQTGATGSTASRFQDGYMPLFLCKKLIQFGTCPRGDTCTFAHGYEELHPASPDLPKMDGAATGMPSVLSEQTQEVDQMPDVKMKRKRSMCQRYQKGECLLGKQCPFAHKEEDLGTVELVLCGNVKTRICKMWTQGKCIYAVNCWDAHGEKEIGLKRPPPELAPKIKRVRKEPYEERQQQRASSSQMPD